MIRFLAFTSNLLCNLLGLLLAGLSVVSPSPQANPPDWAALDRLVDSHQEPGEPGISVAVSVGGQLVYERWAGQADLERAVPIGAYTRFHIGSTSKQFTAFAIMLLAEQGKLSLDQDVRDFIPELEARSTPVTIRHLLNHTSGLREEVMALIPDRPDTSDAHHCGSSARSVFSPARRQFRRRGASGI